jgi:hypothetical protein
VLHDQEAVVILLKDGHQLEAGKGPPYIQFGDIAVQTAKDTGVVSADEEDSVELKVEVAVDGIYQHLRWGDQDVEGVFKQGDCWMQFYFHDEIWGSSGDMMPSRAWGECEEVDYGYVLLIQFYDIF